MTIEVIESNMARSNKIDESTLIGIKFGLLTIERAWRNEKNHIIVNCQCDCGRRWQGLYGALRSSKIKSCGCNSKKRNKHWLNFSINSKYRS